MMTETRQKAWAELRKHVASEVLLKHCLAVEIAMRAYAEKFGEDVEYWGSVGLLHDVDFEKFPHEHPHHAREILSAAGYDDAFITDVESHCRVWEGERSMLQKTLLAVDEMTGFIIACALVRPDREEIGDEEDQGQGVCQGRQSRDTDWRSPGNECRLCRACGFSDPGAGRSGQAARLSGSAIDLSAD